MRLTFLGDSYDIVKQSFLRWLGVLGPWSAHPMFTEVFSNEQGETFRRLLGVPLVSTEVLRTGIDRKVFLAPARTCTTHLFLDPDTGLRVQRSGARKLTAFLFGEELVQIAEARPRLLTLVFDQSLNRGDKAGQLKAKLRALWADGLHGAAYVSHARFLLVGTDPRLVAGAVKTIREQSGLPPHRFV